MVIRTFRGFCLQAVAEELRWVGDHLWQRTKEAVATLHRVCWEERSNDRVTAVL